MTIGNPISGTNIPALSPTGPTTNGSNLTTGMSSVAGVAIGNPISGTNIPANSTVTLIQDTISISQNATGTATGTAFAIGNTTVTAIQDRH